jgi:hypothetical protein
MRAKHIKDTLKEVQESQRKQAGKKPKSGQLSLF